MFRGREVTIGKERDEDGDYWVTTSGGPESWINESHLSAVDELQTNNGGQMFKEGDTAYLVEGKVMASFGEPWSNVWDRSKPVKVLSPVDSTGDIRISSHDGSLSYVRVDYLSNSPTVSVAPEYWTAGDTAWLKEGTLTFNRGAQAVAELNNWDRTEPVTVIGTVDDDGDVYVKRENGGDCYLAEEHLSRTQVVFAGPQWKIGDTAWLKPIDGVVFNSQSAGKANRWDFTQPVTIVVGMDEDGDIFIDNMSGTDRALVLAEYLSRTQVVFPEPEPQVEDRLTKAIREAKLKLASLGEEQETIQENLAILEKAQELLEQ